MRSMHIAVLDEELPFPLTSGKRIRTFNLLARLAARHRVTILCHKNPNRDESLAAEDAFRGHGIETVVVDRAVPSKSGAGFYARLAGNLLSPLPYSVATHASPALAARGEALCRREQRRRAALRMDPLRASAARCDWRTHRETALDRDGAQRRISDLAPLHRERREPTQAVVHSAAAAQVRTLRAVGVLARDRRDCRQPRRRFPHAE